MNDDINKYLKKIIILDNNIKTYRQSADEDIERYRQRNEKKLASLNAYLKDAEQQSFDIKTSRLAEAQKTIDKENVELKEMLLFSQNNFDNSKSQIVQEIFDELFN